MRLTLDPDHITLRRQAGLLAVPVLLLLRDALTYPESNARRLLLVEVERALQRRAEEEALEPDATTPEPPPAPRAGREPVLAEKAAGVFTKGTGV